jgi:hypothetical protein
VSFISSTELRVTVPALVAGTYILYVTNPDGSTAIRVNALTASQAPAWISGSTLLGDQDVAISIQLSAAGATTYAVASGSQLPAGLTLSSSGLLSGTVTGLESETIFNFIVDAIDLELQDSPRSFAITITVGDPNIRYVTTLLSPGLEVAPFNRDASTNNFAVSVLGDTRPNNFGPYTPGYYSNFFDGSGDYLVMPTIVGPGTGDFTLEAWVYPTTAGTGRSVLDSRSQDVLGPLYFGLTPSNKLDLIYSASSPNRLTSTVDVSANTWTHIAAVRSSGTITLYINGVQNGSVAFSGSVNGPGVWWIGAGRSDGSGNPGYYFTGYISNVRVNNSAIYTANFTPSTAPLTAVTNTSLLTCQSNRFVDNSANNFAVTRVGDTQISGFDPFLPAAEFLGRGSTYFDGIGDYLTLPAGTAFGFGTGNFTVEAWVNFANAAGSSFYFIDARNSSQTTAWAFFRNTNNNLDWFNGTISITSTAAVSQLNTWTHIAYTRSGTTGSLFINGILSGTSTDNANYNVNPTTSFIGCRFNTAEFIQGYISNLRVVKGTALYTANFTPPTAPLTAVANTSLLTCQTNQPANNNTFLDSSTNNFLITRNGNTTQGAFSPYGGGWSNYFDGTGDALSSPTTGDLFNFVTGDFCVEAFVNFNTISEQYIVGTYDGANGGWAMYLTSSPVAAINFRNGDGGVVSRTFSFAVRTWYHIAVSRSSSTLRFFVNGIQVGADQTSYTQNITRNNTNGCAVGRYMLSDNQNGGYVNGYISNLRVVKGTALYTAGFTPPTAPLTPIAGTSLLTCCDNRFIDDSPNNFAITRNGDVSVRKFNPFGIQTATTPVTHSAYFDGTDDYLTASSTILNFGTSDFTIELWVYNTTLATTNIPLSNDGPSRNIGSVTFFISAGGAGFGIQRITSTAGAAESISYGSAGSVLANTWNHFAATKVGTTIRLFLNGVLVSTQTSASSSWGNQIEPVQIGRRAISGFEGYVAGYISNLRVVQGTALYTANFTPPTAPLTAVTNTSLLTCQSSTFVDNSSNRLAITAAGNVCPSHVNPLGYTSGTKTSYTPTVYGGSMYFDGTGDYLTVAPTTQTYLSSEPFTMEAWAYPTANNGMIAGRRSAVSARGFLFGFDATNKIRFWAGDSDTNTWNVQLNSANTYALNQWYHIVATRNSSNVFNLWVNGTSVANATSSFTIADDTSTLQIGTVDSGSSPFSGYMTDFRLVKSTALYTSSFVPPATPLIPVTNTTLLLNGTGAAVRDASMSNNLETVGDAKVSTSVVKYGSTSMSFDGVSDWLVVPSSLNFGYGTADFTIEFWLYLNSTALQTVVSSLTSDSSVNPHIYYAANSGIRYYTNNADRISGSALSTGTWHHIALSRSSNSTRLFVNGSQSGSTYTDTNNYGSTAPFAVGVYFNGVTPVSTYTLNGIVSDLRITRGLARYTANFTPPAGAFKAK